MAALPEDRAKEFWDGKSVPSPPRLDRAYSLLIFNDAEFQGDVLG